MNIFKEAVPVWKKGCEKEKNLTLIFRNILKKSDNCLISLSCSSLYQIFINGNFIATGPARAAHGYYKVDTIDISRYLTNNTNIITIYVAGYNVKSFYHLNQPAFLCAEIICSGKVVAATGKSGFEATKYTERIQKVQRYSYQRPFCEVYKADENFGGININPGFSFQKTELANTGKKNFIPRDVYYSEYNKRFAKSIIMEGEATFFNEVLRRYDDRALTYEAEDFLFDRNELEVESTLNAGKINFSNIKQTEQTADNVLIRNNTFKVFDMGINTTGIIDFEISVNSDTEVYFTFDEILKDGFVDYTRMECCNVIIWHLKKGKYHITSFEPYTLRYLCASVFGSEAEISDLNIISVGFPDSLCTFSSGSEKLDLIYNSALETFRQNVSDIYMDCPSRERAGWLCDSFFTARTEYELTGKSVVEKAFLNNFIIPDSFPGVPDGMLPMCYPSDAIGKHHIPNWAMWFVLELEEYLERTADREFIEKAKEKVYGILNFLKIYENEDKLLEKLDGWIFVEWSQANKLVQDINFPTNMLYARFKKAIGNLYNDEKLLEESNELQRKIRELSYFNGFFHDRALINENKKAKVTDEITETCQYYAFFMETATKDTFPELWNTLICDFGPHRRENNKWENIYFSNAFIGNYLRLDLLAKYRYHQQLLCEIEGYFYNMAKTTGTLWEHDNTFASCNHAFTSHIIVWLRNGGNKFGKS
ncbi:MAG: hypothetical protein IJC74_01065 [Clostridia bacterium]|nr:hypothetical protein [Clostridia bacterium]